jgi:trehalose 6-phosphate synthase
VSGATGRLVIVSNRVAPLTGRRVASAGGLAVGVHAALAETGGVWFGWSGHLVAVPGPLRVQRVGPITYALADLSEAEHDGYYAGFSNRALWPTFHYRLDLAVFDRAHFEMYRAVNRRLAAELAALLRPEDRVWVHDYHLIPFARELRRLGVANRIGFFLHIPFPAPEIYVALPWHGSLAEDLCSYDIIGFQTASHAKQFEDYAEAELDGKRGGGGRLTVGNRRVSVGAFPIGIDVDDVRKMASSDEARRSAQSLTATLQRRKLVIGVDRLDYSKGIPDRLLAFEVMLRDHPDWHGGVTLVQVSAPSREDVPEYQQLRTTVEGLAGRINGRLGAADWTPVRYVNRTYSRRALTGFYRVAAVALVTPLRDGMNMVAGEYVAAQDAGDPGVLVMSRFAGAAEVLEGAMIVNPYDIDMTATALHQALAMPIEERRERHARLLASQRANDVHAWRDRFLKALAGEPATPTA